MKPSACALRTPTLRRISIESLLFAVTILTVAVSNPAASAQQNKEMCARPKIGSVVAEPEDVRSKNGLLEITLTAQNAVQPDGTRYCFVDDRGHESPNLRVNPGIGSSFI